MKYLLLLLLNLPFFLFASDKGTPINSKVTEIKQGIPRNKIKFDDFVIRENLMRSFNKIHKNKKARIAYMGGSVTMRPWRLGVQTWLKEKFPETDFDFVMAGVGGTPAELGAFRLKNDVFKNGQVDLLFLEFAVNGGGVKEMEGIVRQAKQLNPNIDIVFMYFANRSHCGDFKKGIVPKIVQEHNKVAKAYKISTISLYSEIARRISKGLMTWGNFARDSVHPNLEGSEMYAACIIDFLEEVWKSPTLSENKPTALPGKLDKKCLDKGHFLPKNSYKNIKGFKKVDDWKPNFRVINIDLPVPIWLSDNSSDEISAEFEGTTVGIYYMSCKDSGVLEYSIDGGRFQSLDTFNDNKNMPKYKILGEGLNNAKHTIILRNSKSRNLKSKGKILRVLHLMAN